MMSECCGDEKNDEIAKTIWEHVGSGEMWCSIKVPSPLLSTAIPNRSNYAVKVQLAMHRALSSDHLSPG